MTLDLNVLHHDAYRESVKQSLSYGGSRRLLSMQPSRRVVDTGVMEHEFKMRCQGRNTLQISCR